jgi:hypothetical protein
MTAGTLPEDADQAAGTTPASLCRLHFAGFISPASGSERMAVAEVRDVTTDEIAAGGS